MAKFGVKEVLDVTFYDTETNKPVLFLDTLKMSSIENTAEETSARGGKGNAKILTWDFNRESSLVLSDALLSPKSFELLSGNKVTSGTAAIHMRQSTEYTTDVAPVNKGSLYPLIANESGEIALAFTPKEVVGDILVYALDDDGGTALEASALTGKTLTCVLAANKKVVVYYTYEVSESETYLITSDSFPGIYKLVGDTVVRNASTGRC